MPLNNFVYDACLEAGIPFPDIPVRGVEHFGQCAEDVIVRALLVATATRKQVDLGTKSYIEIGANHPLATSATYLLSKSLGMKGILVEANADLIDNLKKARPNDTIVCAAVQEKDVDRVMFSVSKNSEISSIDRSWVLNWARGQVGEASYSEVPALRINDLFKTHANAEDVVYLSIDVEGMDLALLQDMDFQSFRPWIVQAEPCDPFVPGNSEAIIAHMSSVGYQLAAKTNVNLIFSDSRNGAVSWKKRVEALAKQKDDLDRANRELYLDLMTSVLTNTIYGDPSNNPINTGPFQKNLRDRGLDWPVVAHTMIGVKRLQNIRTLAQRAIDEDIAGDFIETGIWRGGSCIMMRAVLAANEITDRKVYGCDSFEGLPPPNAALYPQDKDLDLSVHKEFVVSLEEVKENFRKYDLLDDQVVFVKGYFEETLPTFEGGPFARLRLDGDLYESTYLALEHLYPKVSPGGFIVVDDYGCIPPCKQAVSDYREEHGITEPLHEIDWTGVWWQKQPDASQKPGDNTVRATVEKVRKFLTRAD